MNEKQGSSGGGGAGGSPEPQSNVAVKETMKSNGYFCYKPA